MARTSKVRSKLIAPRRKKPAAALLPSRRQRPLARPQKPFNRFSSQVPYRHGAGFRVCAFFCPQSVAHSRAPKFISSSIFITVIINRLGLIFFPGLSFLSPELFLRRFSQRVPKPYFPLFS